MRNQLHDDIAFIKKQARKFNKELIFDFTGDGGSVIIANKQDACVGLVSVLKDGSVNFFDISLNRWQWAKDEGFTTEQMTDPPLKNEIFQRVTVERLVKNLMGE